MKPIFESERLAFWAWKKSDLDLVEDLNSNAQVMKFFPTVPSKSDNERFLQRMIDMQDQEGFCYFKTTLKSTGDFIGLVGLAKQSFDNHLGDFVDIGWRLLPKYWGLGLATEAAQSSLNYGFEHLGLREIKSVAPVANKPSIAVMKSIGMQYKETFLHPKLAAYPSLESCVHYAIAKKNSSDK